MANNHKHKFCNRSEFDRPWSLKIFKNPKVKQVLIGCSVCHPKKKLKVRKTGMILSLEYD